jgi:hypothetical protein
MMKTMTLRRNRALVSFYLAACGCLFSCSAPPPRLSTHREILEYTVLWVDSSQKVFSQCSRPAPKAITRFTPNSVQVDTLIGDLLHYRKELEKSLSLHLEHYLYQIVGFNTNQLYLNCFASSSYHGIPDWRAAPVVACGGGGLYWGIVYTIQTRTFDRFFINSGGGQ